MNWFLFALIAAVAYALAEIVSKYAATKDAEPSYVGLLSAFFSTLVAFGIAFFRHDIVYHFTVLNIIGLIGSTLLTSIGIITYFKALQLSDVSEFALFTRTQILFAFIGGVFIFSDRFSLFQIAGILIMMLGVIVISLSKTKIHFHKGSILAIITAMLFGFAVLIDKAIVNDFSATFYSALYYALNSLFLIIPAFMTYRRIHILPSKRTCGLMFVTGTLYVLSAIWVYTAFQIGGMVSLMTIIAQLQIPIVVLYGIFIFKERDRLSQKIIAMICMGIGAYLLSV